jgi:hypothetical protein
MTPQPFPVPQHIHDERNARRLWAHMNRGIQSKIARKLNVSPGAVNAVLHYELPSKDFRIEKALARAGAPGMRDRLLGLLIARGHTRPQAAKILKALGVEP